MNYPATISLTALAWTMLAVTMLSGTSAIAGERLGTPAAATIDRIIDGDTFEATVHIWIGVRLTTKVRLDGVDTPEITGARCPAERRRGEAARDFVRRFLSARRVSLHDVHQGKYAGRVVAKVSAEDGRDLGAALLNAGLARPYGDRTKIWCEDPAPERERDNRKKSSDATVRSSL